jgi:hypothetical protein
VSLLAFFFIYPSMAWNKNVNKLQQIWLSQRLQPFSTPPASFYLPIPTNLTVSQIPTILDTTSQLLSFYTQQTWLSHRLQPLMTPPVSFYLPIHTHKVTENTCTCKSLWHKPGQCLGHCHDLHSRAACGVMKKPLSTCTTRPLTCPAKAYKICTWSTTESYV